MKFPQCSWINALMLLLGLVLAVLGFGLPNPIARTTLQILALVVLCASVGLGQQLAREGRQILDES